MIKTLDRWLKRETWFKGHPLDMQAFYRCVQAMWAEGEGSVNESEWFKLLSEEVRERELLLVEPDFTNTLEDRAHRAAIVCDYLSAMNGY